MRKQWSAPRFLEVTKVPQATDVGLILRNSNVEMLLMAIALNPFSIAVNHHHHHV